MDLEAEYNNRAKVPDNTAFQARWERDAAPSAPAIGAQRRGLPRPPPRAGDAGGGQSAGGHLAAMLLATHWAARPIGGLFDPLPLTHTSMNGALGPDHAEARCLSPFFLPRPAGRLYVGGGGAEGIGYTRQSRSIVEAWGSTRGALDGRNLFTVLEPFGEWGSTLVQVALTLLSAE